MVFWTVLVLLTPVQQLQNEHENQAKISFGEVDSSINQQAIEKLMNQYKGSSTLEELGIAIAIYGAILLFGYLTVTDDQLRKGKFYMLAIVNATFATLFAGIYYSRTIRFDLVYFSEYTDYYFPINGLITTLISFQLFRHLFKALLSQEPKIVSQRAIITDPANWLFTLLVIFTGVLTGAFLNPIEQLNQLINYLA